MALLGAASPQVTPPAADLQQAAAEAFHVRAISVQELNLPSDEGPFAAVVDLGGEGVTLDLHKHSIRSDRFVLEVSDEQGNLHGVEAPPIRTYRGTVLERPGSIVAASYRDGQLTATILDGDGVVWTIQPLADAVAGAPPHTHVVYRSEDVLPGPWQCGTQDMPDHASHDHSGDAGDGSLALTPYKVCDLAVEADFEFYQKNGSSVANTVFDMENVLNAVETVYERDVAITYEITRVTVWTTSSDPYTTSDSSALLGQFRSWWNANRRDVQRDLAQLMTGRNIDSSVIGIAYLSVVCSSITAGNGYSVVESRFTTNFNSRVALSAHELAHNWSAQHCSGSSCHIMCATLGGCGGIGGSNLKFEASSITSITNHKNSRTCLNDLADPIAPPFFDNFPNMSIDTAKWSYNNGAAISTQAVGEPSGNNSVNLDTAAANQGFDDDLRTNFILLGGTGSAVLSYYTEARTVESGEALTVEYWNNNLTWIELNRIISNGATENSFTFWTHNLPSDALHNEFRVRFRTEVNATDDDWYIDDVQVAADVLTFHELSVDVPGLFFVNIGVSPDDYNGDGDGVAPFVRTFVDATSVTLTAPATVGAVFFKEWQFNGLGQPGGNVITFSITQDIQADAIYEAHYDLNITSSPNSGVLIDVSPADNGGLTDGSTPFARNYDGGQTVTLTAPAADGVGLTFERWLVDGSPQPAGQTTISVDMFGNRSAMATYVASACEPCDTNCDGSVNGFDVDPMVALLSGSGTPCSPCAGDVDGDGSVNGFDVDGFVACLAGP
ncbi:MAG: hypothetical protein CHACPFDD_00383 [Phycisphaerae bacterium]|nr:hypothetical protein [Phycisphaerae bacterium]